MIFLLSMKKWQLTLLLVLRSQAQVEHHKQVEPQADEDQMVEQRVTRTDTQVNMDQEFLKAQLHGQSGRLRLDLGSLRLNCSDTFFFRNSFVSRKVALDFMHLWLLAPCGVASTGGSSASPPVSAAPDPGSEEQVGAAAARTTQQQVPGLSPSDVSTRSQASQAVRAELERDIFGVSTEVSPASREHVVVPASAEGLLSPNASPSPEQHATKTKMYQRAPMLAARGAGTTATRTPFDLLVRHGGLKNLWSHGGFNSWSLEYMSETEDEILNKIVPIRNVHNKQTSVMTLRRQIAERFVKCEHKDARKDPTRTASLFESFTAGLWDHCFSEEMEKETQPAALTSAQQLLGEDHANQDKSKPLLHQLLEEQHSMAIRSLETDEEQNQQTYAAHMRGWQLMQHRYGFSGNFVHRMVRDPRGTPVVVEEDDDEATDELSSETETPGTEPPSTTTADATAVQTTVYSAATKKKKKLVTKHRPIMHDIVYHFLARSRDNPGRVVIVDKMQDIDPQWYLHKVDKKLYIMIGELRNISHFTRWAFWLFELLSPNSWLLHLVKKENLKVFIMGTKFWHDWRDTLPHNNLLLDVVLQSIIFPRLNNQDHGEPEQHPYFTGAEFCNGGEDAQCHRWSPARQRAKKTGVAPAVELRNAIWYQLIRFAAKGPPSEVDNVDDESLANAISSRRGGTEEPEADSSPASDDTLAPGEARFEYMGCFSDDTLERAFEISVGRLPLNMLESCAGVCRLQYHTAYFGIQDGNFCFCTRKTMSLSFGVMYWSTDAELELEEESEKQFDIARFPKVVDADCRVGYSGTHGCNEEVFGGMCGGPWRTAAFRFLDRRIPIKEPSVAAQKSSAGSVGQETEPDPESSSSDQSSARTPSNSLPTSRKIHQIAASIRKRCTKPAPDIESRGIIQHQEAAGQNEELRNSQTKAATHDLLLPAEVANCYAEHVEAYVQRKMATTRFLFGNEADEPVEIATWHESVSNLRSITFAVLTGFYSRHRVDWVVQKARDGLSCSTKSAHLLRARVWDMCKIPRPDTTRPTGGALEHTTPADTFFNKQPDHAPRGLHSRWNKRTLPGEFGGRRCILILRHGRVAGQRQWTNLEGIVSYFEKKLSLKHSANVNECLGGEDEDLDDNYTEEDLKVDHDDSTRNNPPAPPRKLKLSLHVLRMIDLTPCEQVRVMQRAVLVIARHGADVTNLVWMQPDAMLLEINFQQTCQGVKPYMWQTLEPYLDQIQNPKEEKIHFGISGDEGSHAFDRVLLQRRALKYSPLMHCNDTALTTTNHGYYSEFAKTLSVGYDYLELPLVDLRNSSDTNAVVDPQGSLKYMDFFLPIEDLDQKVGRFLDKLRRRVHDSTKEIKTNNLL
ncbi:unnamed protein product [Amoebophrya sp. A120]|nr:unnamed protein product [Amoebophrya sp. A120]|eukprot:GSA120T00002257001.1